jgi:hypothetical protein
MYGSTSSASADDVGERNPTVQAAQVPSSEVVPLVEYKAYPGRFYVLVVTALLTIQQNIAWLTFGPIPDQAKKAYGLTDAELTLLPGVWKIGLDGHWIMHNTTALA